ncbi:MAG: hypothetical protein LBM93_15255 [Oscillospiraceae bacterium]|jgi:hypothetical protein|nr:hypothetical protein [Oscillospiraceae bacterium]
MIANLYLTAELKKATSEPTATTTKSIAETTEKAITPEITSPKENVLLPIMPVNFSFSPGVGGMGISITLSQDGTFTGEYHDYNLAPFGDYSGGDVYRSFFKGVLGNITKIDDLTYSMECISAESTQSAREYKENDTLVTISDDPEYFAFTPGNTYFLYLPGTKTANFDRDFLSDWLYYAREEIKPKELNCFAFSNHMYTGEVEYKSVDNKNKFDTTDKDNLLNSMSTEEIRKLNKLFDIFCYQISLEDIITPEQLIYLSKAPYEDENNEFTIPEELVENELKKYFNVETVEHSSFDSSLYRDGFYESGGTKGNMFCEWYTVHSLKKNLTGTYTAKVYHLYWDKFFAEGYEEVHLPEDTYDRIDKWEMGDFAIVENIGQETVYPSPYTIEIIAEDTVILSPYTLDGEETWRIDSINGWQIPKNLTCN